MGTTNWKGRREGRLRIEMRKLKNPDMSYADCDNTDLPGQCLNSVGETGTVAPPLPGDTCRNEVNGMRVTGLMHTDCRLWNISG